MRSRESTTRRGSFPRRVIGALAWLPVLAALWLLAPTQWGGHLGLTVVSGHSMEPTYYTHDLVFTWKRDTYAPGEVVVYTVPEGDPGEGYHVVHRVRAV